MTLTPDEELELRALEWLAVHRQIEDMQRVLADKAISLRDSMQALNAEKRIVPIPELDATVEITFADEYEWNEQVLSQLPEILGEEAYEKLLTKPKARPVDKRKLATVAKAGGKAKEIIDRARTLKGKKLDIKRKDNV